MRQFILPRSWDGGATCLVEGEDAHYVNRVLRLDRGDTFPGRDSRGGLWTCSILQSEPGRLLLSLQPVGGAHEKGTLGEGAHGEVPQGSAARPRIILVQGLPKGAKMDLVVRQATEAGVSAVVPLFSARALPKEGEGARGRMARWERIVKEALQQSGSAVHTRVLEPLGLAALGPSLAGLGLSPGDPRILLHEAPLAQSSLHGYLTRAPEAVALCVGPEGGFAPEEVELLRAEGWMPLRFAGPVLRAETAALYAIAATQIILSESSSWIPRPP
jgi:16S rRNA (uracil1498-N3)-methyltransferase